MPAYKDEEEIGIKGCGNMSTYVVSDIHGCYDEFMSMLEKIEFSNEDKLIIAGDYIDRGPKSYEMLQWIENKQSNVILLRGNHDEEFAYCVDLMGLMFEKKKLPLNSEEATVVIYELLRELSKSDSTVGAFDYYGTIEVLINMYQVTMEQLDKWNKLIREMPYIHRECVKGKDFLIVHAGYIENLEEADTEDVFESVEDFYLNARDDAYMCGGIPGAVIIAGHTPTIFENEMPYNNGDVYSFYDQEMDCKFYDIDCGCAYKEKCTDAKLACIRLEDEMIIYQ